MTAPFVVWDVVQLADVAIPQGLYAAVVLGGLTVGLLQWRILRPQASSAGWWVLASVIGWALAAATVMVNDRVLPKTPGIVGALIYIGIMLTGGLLLGLWRL